MAIVLKEAKDISKLEGWMIAEAKSNNTTGQLQLRLTHILDESIIVLITPIVIATTNRASIIVAPTLTVGARPLASIGDSEDS